MLRLIYSTGKIQTAIFTLVTSPTDLTSLFKASKKSLKIGEILSTPSEICTNLQRLFLLTRIKEMMYLVIQNENNFCALEEKFCILSLRIKIMITTDSFVKVYFTFLPLKKIIPNLIGHSHMAVSPH